jgi:hypothetical protein
VALGNRYNPTHAPGDAVTFGLDLSAILPLGVGIDDASLEILINTNPTQSQGDWQQGEVAVDGRRVYADCSGGAAGVDYQFRWTVTDSTGSTWTRTVLCLCAETG